MYLIDCIEKILENLENLEIKSPNNIIKHHTRGMKKVSFCKKKDNQLHTVMVYEEHPSTKKKLMVGLFMGQILKSYTIKILLINNKKIKY